MTDERFCARCGKSLAGRSTLARTCSNACKLAVFKARRKPVDGTALVRHVCPLCHRGRYIKVAISPLAETE